MRRFFIALWVLIPFELHCQGASGFTEVEVARPFTGSSVLLKPSWVKHREDLNIAYLKSLDSDRLLHNFRVNAGLPSDAVPLEGWESPEVGLRGHFTGHYLSAVSRIVETYRDSVLIQRLNYLVEELHKCQRAHGNGYLSAFPETDFDVLETNYGGVWAPYYTWHKIMQGLLDAYLYAGIAEAYGMVVDMAAYVEKRMSRLSDETIEKVLYSVGANPTNEAGGMNDVLHQLYRVSKDPRHLALAGIFDRDWFAVPLSENRDILSGLHANTHVALINGFAQRYSATGESKYRDAVVNFWDMLMKSHAYANGSSSGPRPNVTTSTSLTSEHWGVPGHLSSTMTRETSESCVSHNTQKITSALFRWTADPAYADAYMNTFYNAVMALQSAHSGKCVYHLPLGSPRNKVFLEENDFRCCSGTTVEAFSSLNAGIYYHSDSALWVNHYIPSTLHWVEKKVVLEQIGDFPGDPVVEFSLTAPENSSFAINLLAPSWVKGADVYINNERQEMAVSPQSYIRLRRAWKNGDRIKLVFHYDFYLRTMPDDDQVLAVFYGPILLAFEEASELILKGDHNDVLIHLSHDPVSNAFYLTNNGKTYRLKPLYEIEEQPYGVYATLRNY